MGIYSFQGWRGLWHCGRLAFSISFSWILVGPLTHLLCMCVFVCVIEKRNHDYLRHFWKGIFFKGKNQPKTHLKAAIFNISCILWCVCVEIIIIKTFTIKGKVLVKQEEIPLVYILSKWCDSCCFVTGGDHKQKSKLRIMTLGERGHNLKVNYTFSSHISAGH